MSRHDDLLSYLDEMASQFAEFTVAAVNHKELEPAILPISEVIVDEGDNEICIVRGPIATASRIKLDNFTKTLRETIHRYPEYSLMVSEWFELESGYEARVDMPLTAMDLNEVTNEFLLVY